MIEFEPIGIVHTPFKTMEGIPNQPRRAKGVRGTVEVFVEYQAGLEDLDGFSHIILLTYLHRSKGYNLRVVPFMEKRPRGLFATRAPRRPNPIGLSVVQLESVEDGMLHIQNVDLLDGTPLLDVKPYVPEVDSNEAIRTEWLEEARTREEADVRLRTDTLD